jgi:hypothetical protein
MLDHDKRNRATSAIELPPKQPGNGSSWEELNEQFNSSISYVLAVLQSAMGYSPIGSRPNARIVQEAQKPVGDIYKGHKFEVLANEESSTLAFGGLNDKPKKSKTPPRDRITRAVIMSTLKEFIELAQDPKNFDKLYDTIHAPDSHLKKILSLLIDPRVKGGDEHTINTQEWMKKLNLSKISIEGKGRVEGKVIEILANIATYKQLNALSEDQLKQTREVILSDYTASYASVQTKLLEGQPQQTVITPEVGIESIVDDAKPLGTEAAPQGDQEAVVAPLTEENLAQHDEEYNGARHDEPEDDQLTTPSEAVSKASQIPAPEPHVEDITATQSAAVELEADKDVASIPESPAQKPPVEGLVTEEYVLSNEGSKEELQTPRNPVDEEELLPKEKLIEKEREREKKLTIRGLERLAELFEINTLKFTRPTKTGELLFHIFKNANKIIEEGTYLMNMYRSPPRKRSLLKSTLKRKKDSSSKITREDLELSYVGNQTILHHAILRGKLQESQKMVEDIMNLLEEVDKQEAISFINKKDYYGHTAWDYAVAMRKEFDNIYWGGIAQIIHDRLQDLESDPLASVASEKSTEPAEHHVEDIEAAPEPIQPEAAKPQASVVEPEADENAPPVPAYLAPEHPPAEDIEAAQPAAEDPNMGSGAEKPPEPRNPVDEMAAENAIIEKKLSELTNDEVIYLLNKLNSGSASPELARESVKQLMKEIQDGNVESFFVNRLIGGIRNYGFNQAKKSQLTSEIMKIPLRELPPILAKALFHMSLNTHQIELLERLLATHPNILHDNVEELMHFKTHVEFYGNNYSPEYLHRLLKIVREYEFIITSQKFPHFHTLYDDVLDDIYDKIDSKLRPRGEAANKKTTKRNVGLLTSTMDRLKSLFRATSSDETIVDEINAAQKGKKNLLHHAVSESDVKAVMKILNAATKSNKLSDFINIIDEDGHTALHYARDRKIRQLLRDNGAKYEPLILANEPEEDWPIAAPKLATIVEETEEQLLEEEQLAEEQLAEAQLAERQLAEAQLAEAQLAKRQLAEEQLAEYIFKGDINNVERQLERINKYEMLPEILASYYEMELDLYREGRMLTQQFDITFLHAAIIMGNTKVVRAILNSAKTIPSLLNELLTQPAPGHRDVLDLAVENGDPKLIEEIIGYIAQDKNLLKDVFSHESENDVQITDIINNPNTRGLLYAIAKLKSEKGWDYLGKNRLAVLQELSLQFEAIKKNGDKQINMLAERLFNIIADDQNLKDDLEGDVDNFKEGSNMIKTIMELPVLPDVLVDNLFKISIEHAMTELFKKLKERYHDKFLEKLGDYKKAVDNYVIEHHGYGNISEIYHIIEEYQDKHKTEMLGFRVKEEEESVPPPPPTFAEKVFSSIARVFNTFRQRFFPVDTQASPVEKDSIEQNETIENKPKEGQITEAIFEEDNLARSRLEQLTEEQLTANQLAEYIGKGGLNNNVERQLEKINKYGMLPEILTSYHEMELNLYREGRVSTQRLNLTFLHAAIIMGNIGAVRAILNSAKTIPSLLKEILTQPAPGHRDVLDLVVENGDPELMKEIIGYIAKDKSLLKDVFSFESENNVQITDIINDGSTRGLLYAIAKSKNEGIYYLGNNPLAVLKELSLQLEAIKKKDDKQINILAELSTDVLPLYEWLFNIVALESLWEGEPDDVIKEKENIIKRYKETLNPVVFDPKNPAKIIDDLQIAINELSEKPDSADAKAKLTNLFLKIEKAKVKDAAELLKRAMASANDPVTPEVLRALCDNPIAFINTYLDEVVASTHEGKIIDAILENQIGKALIILKSANSINPDVIYKKHNIKAAIKANVQKISVEISDYLKQGKDNLARSQLEQLTSPGSAYKALLSTLKDKGGEVDLNLYEFSQQLADQIEEAANPRKKPRSSNEPSSLPSQKKPPLPPRPDRAPPKRSRPPLPSGEKPSHSEKEIERQRAHTDGSKHSNPRQGSKGAKRKLGRTSTDTSNNRQR